MRDAFSLKPPFSKSDLVRHLVDMGVAKGQVVIVHSAFSAVAPTLGGPDTVVDALIEAVGEGGTVVFPTFTFSYCEKRFWSRQETPSEVGVISEVARNREGFLRSLHPIYSVVAYGAHAKDFSQCCDKNGVGEGSPFSLLDALDGVVILAGVGYTQGLNHYPEWKFGVTYRYNKNFFGVVQDNSKIFVDNYSMLVRDVDRGVVTDFRKVGYMMEHAGKVRVGRFGWSIARAIRARDFREAVFFALENNIDSALHYIDLTGDKKPNEKLNL